MQTLRHHIVSPLLSLLLVAGLAAPSLHAITHVAHEAHSPYETERAGDTPASDAEECELCALAATLVGIESEATSVSPVYSARQHCVSAGHLVHALLCPPTDARAPPATA